ncbi:hypothetical protein FKM82_005174 [Ascaphus truei]
MVTPSWQLFIDVGSASECEREKEAHNHSWPDSNFPKAHGREHFNSTSTSFHAICCTKRGFGLHCLGYLEIQGAHPIKREVETEVILLLHIIAYMQPWLEKLLATYYRVATELSSAELICGLHSKTCYRRRICS